jgi:hypothetical protein
VLKDQKELKDRQVLKEPKGLIQGLKEPQDQQGLKEPWVLKAQ